jgi:hypothetical protein
MKNALQPVQPNIADTIAKIVLQNDLSSLSDSEIVLYHNNLCNQLGLNPLTNPFSLITLQGKKTLYANRNACDQLMKIHGLSSRVISKEIVGDILMYEVEVFDKERSVSNLGAVTIGKLQGEGRANAYMKAHTKAMRRAVLSFAGLSLLDETEVETIPNAKPTPLAPERQTPLTDEQVKALEKEQEENEALTLKIQAMLNAIHNHISQTIADDEAYEIELAKLKKGDAWLANNPSNKAKVEFIEKLKVEYKEVNF